MRTIKFRAWDKEQSEMLNPGEGKILVISTNGVTIDSEHFEVMQFTGLFDKNGKEIYEGDIVLTPQEEYIKQWVIEFQNGKFQLSNNLNSERDIEVGQLTIVNSCYVNDIEVIDNVYENPELLN